MGDDYILVNKFLDDETISKIITTSSLRQEKDSLVGTRVDKNQKIRKDCFLSQCESKEIDTNVFYNIKKMVEDNFDICLKYRETYKIGNYYGEDGGFYNPHTDTQSGMNHRKISTIICLSNATDYEGGIFKFIKLNKEFKLDIGDAIIFKSELLHGVDPLITGKRQVLISFAWDDFGESIRNKKSDDNRRYIPLECFNSSVLNTSIVTSENKNFDFNDFSTYHDNIITNIPPDSGPGNQIVSIKETIILAKILNKMCLIPPIREHYLKSNTIFYNFKDIFTLTMSCVLLDDKESNILNGIDNKRRYCFHSNYTDKPLRHEDIIKSKLNENILLKKRSIANIKDTDELKGIDSKLIIVKHIFNNVRISESGINGDFSSDLNSNFKSIYQEICSNWDYSQTIKNIGNVYIHDVFKNLKYNSIHIRLPDVMKNDDITGYTNGVFNNKKVLDIVSKLNSENIPLFIASNNVNFLKTIGINGNFMNVHHKYNSFIEQYICASSNTFYYLNLEDTRFGDKNNRSTWTSFVIDYRTFFNKLNNNINLINDEP